jgi:hypothetical protein
MFRDSARKENHESLGKICGAESSLFKKVGVLASIALKRKHNVTIIISWKLIDTLSDLLY